MCPIFPSLIVYAPLMHPELLPPDLPSGLAVLRPGLPSSRPGGAQRSVAEGESARGVNIWCPEMPYTPAEAAACLADFKALEQDALKGTPVQALASCRHPGGTGVGEEEARALAKFAAGGAAGLVPPRRPDDERRRAQRLLLLAWLQEERILEMEALLGRCRTGAASLAGALGSGGPGEDGEGGAAFLSPEEKEGFSGPASEDVRAELPSWRFVLEQMAVFLPAEAALFTADARVLAAWEEARAGGGGEEDEACGLLPQWDAAVRRRLVSVKTPLRRLLGTGRPHPGISGLDAVRFVFMYRK